MNDYGNVTIHDINTHEIVHTIKITQPPGTSNYERFLSGLYRKVDFDRFYVKEPE